MKKLFFASALFLFPLIMSTRGALAVPPPPGSTCGTENAVCCTGSFNPCNSGLTCTSGRCQQPGATPFSPPPSSATCGGVTQPCCSGSSCDAGLSCTSGMCLTSNPAPMPGNAGESPTCNYGGGTNNGINTAIGCIPITDTNAFIGFILKWAIGIGGGIAFLLIIYAGFMIMTSSGNPERLKAGQELLTSAIAGIIMLIFSVFILRVIGINILGIFQ